MATQTDTLQVSGIRCERCVNRLAVARALAARTPVIIADEPTSRVDVAAALTLGGLFADIAHEHGTTFICATHDPVLIGFADVDVQLRRAGAAVPST